MIIFNFNLCLEFEIQNQSPFMLSKNISYIFVRDIFVIFCRISRLREIIMERLYIFYCNVHYHQKLGTV